MLCFVFARGVYLNIALKGTFEKCVCVPFYVYVILVFILEETGGS